jgi:hypothetical protein
MRLAAVLLFAAVAATIIATLPAGAAPPPPVPGPKNPSFEGGFGQWTVDLTSGGTAVILPGQVRPGGGSRYAQLTAESPTIPTSVSQTFTGTAGTTVTGFARFNNNDESPGPFCSFDDSAQVTIDAVPVFQASSCTTGDTGGVIWTYVLPSTGSHTIVGEVVNFFDTIADSSLDMDAPVIYKVP